MQENLHRFFRAARGAGVHVSPAESIDAMRAVASIGLSDRTVLRDSLLLTLAKSEDEKKALGACFDLFFAHVDPAQPEAKDDEAQQDAASSEAQTAQPSDQSVQDEANAELGPLAQMLLAQGIDIKRAVLAFWVGYAAAELHPLWRRLREIILTASKIAVDETMAPVLEPGRGRTKKGFFWAIARDDRPWGGADPPAVAYTYAPGRGAIHALELLDGYRGIVQCDGYAAYKTLANGPAGEAITLAFCWSHLRRRFYDVAENGPAPIASEALARIAALYGIEKTISGRSAEERRAIRQERSKPIVLALETWFELQLTRVSGKAKIAEHIRYALNHWDGLTRFLDDGRIELDTNIVERSIRPLVLNRKNALFAGHDQGAENWACIASLIETCKLCGVEPQAYLTDVLTRLVNLWPASRLDELMPWAWAKQHASQLAV